MEKLEVDVACLGSTVVSPTMKVAYRREVKRLAYGLSLQNRSHYSACVRRFRFNLFPESWEVCG